MKAIHVCLECGKRKQLDPYKKHYHDCKPGAQFVVITDKLMSERISHFYRLVTARSNGK